MHVVWNPNKVPKGMLKVHFQKFPLTGLFTCDAAISQGKDAPSWDLHWNCYRAMSLISASKMKGDLFMELVAQQNMDSVFNHLDFTELLLISLVITSKNWKWSKYSRRFSFFAFAAFATLLAFISFSFPIFFFLGLHLDLALFFGISDLTRELQCRKNLCQGQQT